MSLVHQITIFTELVNNLTVNDNLSDNLIFEIIQAYNQIIIYINNSASEEEFILHTNQSRRLDIMMRRCYNKYTYNRLSGRYTRLH